MSISFFLLTRPNTLERIKNEYAVDQHVQVVLGNCCCIVKLHRSYLINLIIFGSRHCIRSRIYRITLSEGYMYHSTMRRFVSTDNSKHVGNFICRNYNYSRDALKSKEPTAEFHLELRHIGRSITVRQKKRVLKLLMSYKDLRQLPTKHRNSRGNPTNFNRKQARKGAVDGSNYGIIVPGYSSFSGLRWS